MCLLSRYFVNFNSNRRKNTNRKSLIATFFDAQVDARPWLHVGFHGAGHSVALHRILFGMLRQENRKNLGGYASGRSRSQ